MTHEAILLRQQGSVVLHKPVFPKTIVQQKRMCMDVKKKQWLQEISFSLRVKYCLPPTTVCPITDAMLGAAHLGAIVKDKVQPMTLNTFLHNSCGDDLLLPHTTVWIT